MYVHYLLFTLLFLLFIEKYLGHTLLFFLCAYTMLMLWAVFCSPFPNLYLKSPAPQNVAVFKSSVFPKASKLK